MKIGVAWYKSIRFKLMIPIALAFIILSFIITSLITRESVRLSEQILTELKQEITLRVGNSLNDKLEQAIKLNESHMNALNNQILSIEDESNRERYFSAMLKPFDDFAMTFIGLPDGSFYGARRLKEGTLQIVRNDITTSGHSEYYDIDASGNSTALAQVFENFDARTRPWYQTALETKAITFSPMYSHFVFKVPTITASIPYYEQGDLVGIFGVDLLMTWLAETLDDISVGENGTVFIVNSEDQLVATSTHEDIFRIVEGQAINISALDSGSEVIREAIKSIQNNDHLTDMDLEGHSYLVGREEINAYGLNWKVYTIIDKDDYASSLGSTISRINVIVVIASVVFLIFIAYSNYKFAEPIITLSTQAKMLTSGSFEPVKSFNHSPEMTQLINGFNEMGHKIQSYVGDLEREVQNQTKRYEKAANDAQAANVAKSRFLATMSHELRTPLSGILGMVELLKTTALDEEQTDYVNLAEHTSQTLLQLINGVLDYSKIEAQQVEIEKLPFKKTHLKQDIEDLERLYIRSKNLAFVYTLDEEIPDLLIGDRFRIRQILTNLIGNAVKFTEKGQISVSVVLENMDADNNEVCIRLSVTDTGIGVPMAQQANLFKPFNQADTSTTRKYGGTGLGLAISKNLVELMQGEITLTSEENVGSTFTFTCVLGYLDKNSEHTDVDEVMDLASDVQSDWIQEIMRKPLRILLAEDSKINYTYIERIVKKSNWQLIHALNGEEAVALYIQNKNQIDVILMDVEMPIMDGYEATEKIRSIENDEHIPATRIIAISANILVGEREKCLESGMDAYLSKPFRIEQLLRLL